jgi:hypothetical protein
MPPGSGHPRSIPERCPPLFFHHGSPRRPHVDHALTLLAPRHYGYPENRIQAPAASGAWPAQSTPFWG